MRFAYADPPYPGQARRWYGHHPDYAGEVDHAELVDRLCRDYPDGWALSTNGKSLQTVLALCPPVEVAIWHNTNSAHPGARADRIWRVWEPVLVAGGRRGGLVVRNLLACGPPNGFHGAFNGDTFPGKKPAQFADWVLNLLGWQAGDTIDDLFPGSGACSAVFAARAAQPELL